MVQERLLPPLSMAMMMSGVSTGNTFRILNNETTGKLEISLKFKEDRDHGAGRRIAMRGHV